MAQVNTAEDLTSTEFSSGNLKPEQLKSEATKPEDTAFEDRRVWQRFLLEEPASITLNVDGRDPYDGVALLDISLGGFRLQFDGDLPHDSDIAICHPTAGTMRGRLAWQTDGDVGIEILDDENRRTYLLRLISMILYNDMQVAAV